MVRRWLDPCFFTDEKLAKATIEERHLFAAMVANQDDDGRLLAHPGYLRSIAFPYDELSNEDVKKMRDCLSQVNPNIIVYENSEVEYIQLKRHRRYQRPRYYHPSKFPAAPGWPFEEQQPSSNHEVTTESPSSNQEDTEKYTEGRVGRGGVGLDLDNTPKGARKRASPNPVVAEIFNDIKIYLGYPERIAEDPIPNYGKEGQAIKRMLTRGFTREGILALWKSKVDQCGGEFVSMTWVNEDIGKRKTGGKGEGQQRKGVRAKPKQDRRRTITRIPGHEESPG